MTGKEYPHTFAELEKRFKSDADCYDYLMGLRWPNGFVCPKCGSNHYWKMSNGLLLCAGCRRQQSVLAGTVLHRSHLPIKVWFRAMWYICASKTGVSALNLQQCLGIASYNTAWLCLHKLRRAMVHPGRTALSGTVEADETYLGAPQEGKRGRGAFGKRIVFVAVETKKVEKKSKKKDEVDKVTIIGRIRLLEIPDASAASLRPAVISCISEGSTVSTDGWSGYDWMQKSGYTRLKVNEIDEPVAECVLPKCHLVISLFKRWMGGTLQGNLGADHLQDYLNEFVFRFNRRTSSSRGLLFYRLAELIMGTTPNPRSTIIGGGHQHLGAG